MNDRHRKFERDVELLRCEETGGLKEYPDVGTRSRSNEQAGRPTGLDQAVPLAGSRAARSFEEFMECGGLSSARSLSPGLPRESQ